jgi:hypothetical protein
MKTLVAFAVVLLAASQLSAQTPPAVVQPKAPAVAKPVDPKAPVTPAKKADKKADVMGVIPGTTITRADGTFLGLEVVGGNFKLSFYDKKKKPVAPDVTRANARWQNSRGPGDLRTVLNPSGNALIGAKPVVPPFTFTVYLTLIQGEGDEAKAVENFVVPFRG